MEKQINISKLLKTDSLQELAQFWDTHDLTDFADELEEVDEPVFAQEAIINISPSAAERGVDRYAPGNRQKDVAS